MDTASKLPANTLAPLPLDPIRMRLIRWSTYSIIATLIFLFVVAAAFKTPLGYGEILRTFSQLLPVFLGFVASALVYIFRGGRGGSLDAQRFVMLSHILNSSFAAYWTGIILLIGSFVWSHSRYAPLRAGIDTEVFFGFLTLLLSIITITVGAISMELFHEQRTVRRR